MKTDSLRFGLLFGIIFYCTYSFAQFSSPVLYIDSVKCGNGTSLNLKSIRTYNINHRLLRDISVLNFGSGDSLYDKVECDYDLSGRLIFDALYKAGNKNGTFEIVNKRVMNYNSKGNLINNIYSDFKFGSVVRFKSTYLYNPKDLLLIEKYFDSTSTGWVMTDYDSIGYANSKKNYKINFKIKKGATIPSYKNEITELIKDSIFIDLFSSFDNQIKKWKPITYDSIVWSSSVYPREEFTFMIGLKPPKRIFNMVINGYDKLGRLINEERYSGADTSVDKSNKAEFEYDQWDNYTIIKSYSGFTNSWTLDYYEEKEYMDKYRITKEKDVYMGTDSTMTKYYYDNIGRLTVDSTWTYRGAWTYSHYCLHYLDTLVSVKKVNNKELELIMFPNPTDGIINMTQSISHKNQITLIDALGKRHTNFELINENTIYLSALKPGVYYYIIQESDTIFRGKILLFK